jgi:hypothetical protein
MPQIPGVPDHVAPAPYPALPVSPRRHRTTAG